MANIIIAARGGQPDFKGWMCEGQWSEYGPPYNTPQVPGTPPFNSHADAAYEQGFLTLHFPLNPACNGDGNLWMQNALKAVKQVGDVFITNWIPTRAYLDSVYWEVTKTDPRLDGVYVKPVAMRIQYDFDAEQYLDPVIVDDFEAELVAAGIGNLPLGTPAADDDIYAMTRLGLDPAKKPSTFGHNITKKDATGKSIAGYDDYFGNVLLGYQVVDGDAAKIRDMWKCDFEIYFSGKLLAFEGAAQVG